MSKTMIGSDDLSNVEETAKANPKTFKIPSRKDRKTLKPGDHAKLIFCEEERMWVKVTGVEGNRYLGELDNEPIVLTSLTLGDAVVFGPEHICQLHRADD